MEKILLGKPVALAIFEKLRSQMTGDLKPTMALIRIGNDPASDFYVKNIIKQASHLGLMIQLQDLPVEITTEELETIISRHNTDVTINGIMIQKPLPHHISEDVINLAINPDKDIDGIHPLNLGRIFMSQEGFSPCTASAVMSLIKFYKIETQSRHVVILGRSSVVAKPLAGFLLQKNHYGNATISLCHSFTKNLSSITTSADILISAIGKPYFVKASMIKENAVCLDVGINLVSDKVKGSVYVGDIDYNSCFDKALAITPVPGGIGSVTTSVLLENLVKAALMQKTKKNS
jgi:methylenetetrahydrofolate dehydrogenase (NADP+)/methenyltetrahydrofolate cyclohydrolase